MLKSFFTKKETFVQVFFSEFCEIFKNIIFIEHLRWLILYNLTLLNSSTKMLILSLDEHEWAWARFVKLFTCDHALDIVIVLLILRYLFWHFDSVLMGCFEHVSPHGVLSPMHAEIKNMAQNRFPYQVFLFHISIFSQAIRRFAINAT